jgi:hypothetical protein
MEEGGRKRARTNESVSSEDESDYSDTSQTSQSEEESSVDYGAQLDTVERLMDEVVRDLNSLTDRQVNKMVNGALAAFLETISTKGPAYELVARSIIQSCIHDTDGRAGPDNADDFLDNYPDFLATAKSRKDALIRE